MNSIKLKKQYFDELVDIIKSNNLQFRIISFDNLLQQIIHEIQLELSDKRYFEDSNSLYSSHEFRDSKYVSLKHVINKIFHEYNNDPNFYINPIYKSKNIKYILFKEEFPLLCLFSDMLIIIHDMLFEYKEYIKNIFFKLNNYDILHNLNLRKNSYLNIPLFFVRKDGKRVFIKS
jgi:hypothetical protein